MRDLCFVLALMAACGDDDPAGTTDATTTTTTTTATDTSTSDTLQDPGQITVTWSNPGAATCDSLGVTRVEARVYDDDRVIASESETCTGATGTITVAGLQPGSYDVLVDGIDAENTPTHRVTVANVAVASNANAEVAAALVALPAGLVVRWELPDDADCEAAGVADVRVEVFAGSTAVANDEDVCDDGDVRFDALEPAVDVRVVATALDAEGDAVASGEVTGLVLLRGRSLDVTVELED